MNDGQTAFFSEGAGGTSWNCSEVVSKLVRQDLICKIIVVALHPCNRFKEYTLKGKGLRQYSHYVANQVKPWVDAHYRTLRDKEHTAILGSSYGAMSAFYIAMSFPKTFGFAGLLSVVFSLSKQYLWEWSLLNDSSKHHIKPKFWVDYGTKEPAYAEHAIFTKNALLKLGYQLQENLFFYHDDGEHQEAAWHRRLPLVLVTFFGNDDDG